MRMEHKNQGHEEMNHEKTPEENEISMWRKRLIWSWAISIPVILLMYSELIFNIMLFEKRL